MTGAPSELPELPEDLAGWSTAGAVLYPVRGHRTEGLSLERLEQLAAEGWLTKSVRYCDDEDEVWDVEQDPEDGTWWCEGGQVPHERVMISFLTTKKVAATVEARTLRLARSLTDLQEDVDAALKLAVGLGSSESALRLRLCRMILSRSEPLSNDAAACAFEEALSE